MFVLDTNVLSTLMSPNPAPQMASWVANQPITRLFTTAVCQAEIRAGLAIMPQGQRRAALEEAAGAMFTDDFAGRILPFDSTAASAYAEIIATRRLAGRPTATLDVMIASIARTHGAAVVTRDSAGFDGCDVRVIDPWAAS
jgi:hypothetical protein